MSPENEIINKYLRMNHEVMYYGNPVAAGHALDILAIRKEYEAPDFYAIENDTIWIFEHFSFDDAKRVKNNSSFLKRDEAERDRFHEKAADVNVLSAAYQSCVRHTIQSYIDNLTSSYDRHYARIDTYKSNLLNEGIAQNGQEFHVCFVIEDSNPYGTTYWDDSLADKPDGYPAPVLFLPKCYEFLLLFKDSPKVDSIISLNKEDEKTYCIWYLDKESLDQHLGQSIKLADIKDTGIEGLTAHAIFETVAGPNAGEILEKVPTEFRTPSFDFSSKFSWVYPSQKKK